MKAFILASCLVAAASLPGDKIVPMAGDPAPLFEGTWLSYQDSSLEQLEGRLVFIEFWRTW